MSIADEIETRLKSHAGLAALIADRAYPVKLPQESTTLFPAVAFRQVSEGRRPLSGRDAAIVTSRWQLDVLGITAASVHDVALQIKGSASVSGALDRWTVANGSVVVHYTELLLDSEIYDHEAALFVRNLDFRIDYEE